MRKLILIMMLIPSIGYANETFLCRIQSNPHLIHGLGGSSYSLICNEEFIKKIIKWIKLK